ncbi:hypothetical protein OG423_14230 [Micromonospora zamorensis]|uniref:hypothetical protein n=1 Tax=Micromonospora zamorensis TaxID=709883 RepID=UPI00352BB823|nr:hypothetical protein OG423_14230 [Micromonospora zamorensis]
MTQPLPPHVAEWLRQSVANHTPGTVDDINRLRARIQEPAMTQPNQPGPRDVARAAMREAATEAWGEPDHGGQKILDHYADTVVDALTTAGCIPSGRPTPHLDAVKAERDKLVETVGRMISLPPHLVAEAYGVTYTGEVPA